MLFIDDISYCADKECTNIDCFRHMSHTPKPKKGEKAIYTVSFLSNTELCPLYLTKESTFSESES